MLRPARDIPGGRRGIWYECADAVPEPPQGGATAVRVVIDGRALRPGAGHRRGVARYLRCVLEALATLFPDDRYTVLVPGAGEPEPFEAPGVTIVRTRLPGRVVFGAAAVTGRPRLDRLAGGGDVAWVPAPAPVAVSKDLPYLLTLHDLSFEHRPGDYSPYIRLWHRLARPRELARGASRVACVSDAVRRVALEAWGLDPDRVCTVPSGPGRQPGPPGALPPGLPDSFVLAVGALEPRKRPELLADAHRLARRRGLTAGLVFAGEGPLRRRLERTGATVLGYVPDATLDALYARALALACVSHDEGFGFTPLEALPHGTPAVVTGLPAFAETLGGGALLLPEPDPHSLADALLRLEHEPELRATVVAAGRKAVGRLSWERTAASTRELLAAAAGRTG
jgi:glycosyltransferase involved in cell wall biosynthesis